MAGLRGFRSLIRNQVEVGGRTQAGIVLVFPRPTATSRVDSHDSYNI